MSVTRTRLSDLIVIKNGKDHQALSQGPYPVYGSGGVMRYVSEYLYDGEAVLLPRKGTLSNIQYAKGKFWTVDTTYYAIVNKNKADTYFLYHLLNHLDLSGLDSGASIPSMTARTYYSIKIDLPDLTTQKRIANILSTYDSLIEANNRRIELLEQTAQELYKEWFVRFRFPGHENAKFEDGIPEGWEIKRMLEIGLSLVNDRLFIRITNSNLCADDHLLSVVYLPTFAGVLPKENKATIAERRAFLGRGMAGSVIRNMIYDLYLEDKKLRDTLSVGKTRLSHADKQTLNEKSPLQKLQNNLRSTFSSQLEIEPFSEDFHTVLKVFERKMICENGTLVVLPKSKYTPRDIITQGSGYLQWLSIFSILYSSNIDILLLDEPDAHLHASLQSELLNQLRQAVESDHEKQILVSTHSVEMIKQSALSPYANRTDIFFGRCQIRQ